MQLWAIVSYVSYNCYNQNKQTMVSTIEDALKKELSYIVGKCKKVHYRQSMGVHKKTKNRL